MRYTLSILEKTFFIACNLFLIANTDGLQNKGNSEYLRESYSSVMDFGAIHGGV